ncbi:MAG: hypothetical protein K8R92_11295 [Planctomycetes bacterium]|nr:hypothetical protein [Planctomycetota bacterium]
MKKRRRLPVMICAGAMAMIGAILYWLSTLPPGWLRAALVPDAAMEQRSAFFEQALAAQFTKVRGEDRVWAIRISENDMNEWLASRLPKWLEFEHPDLAKKVGKVQVRCLDDHMEIAAENSWGVGSVAIAPKMHVDSAGGKVNLETASAAIGRLPIPAFLVSTFRPTDLFDSLRDSEFRLADGRRVKVRDIEVLPGEIRLQLETSPTRN